MEEKMKKEEIVEKIFKLKKEKDVVILAHNYQRPEIQDIADFVGDSLGLSQEARKVKESVILFCGVHFMAETASILSPEKKVLIPDLEAGCSLSDSLTLHQLKEWKKRYPDAVVVTYVNTSAEVKALSDYCVTSSNAVKVVNSIPEDKTILFGPDMFWGHTFQELQKKEYKTLGWRMSCPFSNQRGRYYKGKIKSPKCKIFDSS